MEIRLIRNATKGKIDSLVLLIIILIAILAILTFLLIMQMDAGDESKSVNVKDQPNRILLKNQKIVDDNLYMFELKNTYSVKKECWATLNIIVDTDIVSTTKDYVGIIEPNETVLSNISFDYMPQGLSSFKLESECENVNYD